MAKNESVIWRAEMMTFFDRNVWSHVALTWSRAGGGQLHVYVNGEPVAEHLHGYNVLSYPRPTWSDFVLGSLNQPEHLRSQVAGEMSMDELRIWDAIFDPNEIKELYVSDLLP